MYTLPKHQPQQWQKTFPAVTQAMQVDLKEEVNICAFNP